MIGDRLGPYEIVGKLGAGGMGEVWRARDTRLDREVALKLLPAGFADDAERHTRFEREAKLLASLNHPYIAHLYALEHLVVEVDSRQSTVDSSPAHPDFVSNTSGHGPRATGHAVERAPGALHVLVMELVEGEDLAARLSRGAIPLDEAIAIARQITEALEAAHERGIVHRDLKPANVKVRPDGTVKVLDFGLAKAVDAAAQADPSFSPTMTHAATQAGLILGTAAYMSPEQARGKVVDKRADVWAFGVVLYEMLAGRRLFDGDTVTDVLAAVVKSEPDWSALPADTPAGIRRLLRRCLQKDPALRLHDIADARLEITDSDASGDPGPVVPDQRPLSRRRLAATASIALAALAAGAAGGVWWRGLRDAAPTAWTATRLDGPAVADLPRLSPDGQLLAFLAQVDRLSQVAVMKPGTSSWTVLTHDRAHGLVDSLNWAADGSRIYYDRWTDTPSGIYSVPALGGDERLVIENASLPQPLADGSLLFLRINSARQLQLHRFWPGTGRIDALPVVTPFNTATCRLVRPLRDGRVAVFGQPLSGGERGNALYSLALDSGEMRRVGPDMPETDFLALAVRPDDGTIVAAVREAKASTYRIVELTSGRASTPRPLMTLLSRPTLEAGPDRALYISLMDRPVEILRFRESARGVELMAGGPGLCGVGSVTLYGIVPTSDGRVLVTARAGDGWRVLVAAPGKEPSSLVETDEDTRGPMTPLGRDRVALLIGPDPAPEIAIVAVAGGRILRRLAAPRNIDGMAASPDGRTLYVAANHSILAVPAEGGSARTICPGDSLAVDPATGDLIVKLDELDRFRLVRVTPNGGAPRPIAIHGDLRLVTEPLTPGAVRDGRLVLPVATGDSWYWYAAVLDLSSGRLEKIPLDYSTDFHSMTWTPDGSVIGAGVGVQSSLWRFAPVGR